jgi:glucosamine-6-phosphate deaminase
MSFSAQPTRRFQVNSARVEIHASREAMGAAAAERAANAMRRLADERAEVAVMFATGASQLATLASLTAIPGLPWERVVGFHMDEYLGLDGRHPASFRRYLREHLHSRVPMMAFHGIAADAGKDPTAIAGEYAELLRKFNPQLCLLGIGENGHLAFNDPGDARFDDPEDVKIVNLDRACRQQQVAEGWFKSFDEVPSQAITVTIPALMRIPELICSVPGPRKAEIVRRTLTEAISAELPATALRRHGNATIYLDRESAAGLS